MFNVLSYLFIGLIILGTTGITIPTIKFLKNKDIAEKEWQTYKAEKINSIKAVKNLKILPLIDYYTDNDELLGESGVSYLIKADDTQILFDVGFNMKNEHPSPLLNNMEKLNVNIDDIDSIFISHLHVDHVGGPKAKKNRTFALSGKKVDLKRIKAYVPVEMVHENADIEVLEEPAKIADGIVSIDSISRAIWGMGLTKEQALAINVENKGIILVVGCGHQSAEKILERAKQLFDEPIYGLIGGLHFPVTKRDDKIFNIRRILGTGKLPWNTINQTDVENTIENISKEDINIIGISAHDSCDWTIAKFKEKFGEKYEDILVGKEIEIKCHEAISKN